MPLIFEKNISEHSRVAVWHTTESDSWFANKLKLTPSEEETLQTMKPRRQKEWLSSRHLIHELTGTDIRISVDKDFCGKPSLQGKHQHISISHSRDMIAAAYSDHCIGIDIQHEEQKITRIKDKFISATEMQHIDLDHLLESYHIFWGAKECMYKAYGLKELDFRKHMHLFPFKYYQDNLELHGQLSKGNVEQQYFISTEKVDSYFLVIASLL